MSSYISRGLKIKEKSPSLNLTIQLELSTTMIYYYDDIALYRWEKQYEQNKPRHTFRELIDIFEAGDYLKAKLVALKTKKKELADKIKRLFLKNYQLNTGSDRMVWQEWIKINLGKEINKTEREIIKINWAISPPSPTSTNGITDEQIKRAKEYSIIDILTRAGFIIRNQMTNCFLHTDKNPSANLKNNWFYCHSCQQSFDSIGLVMALDNIGFVEAVKKLN